MKSSVIKRSIVIDGHKTSVSLEDAFWDDLKKIAHARQVTLSELVTKIDLTRDQGNLSSAIRLFVLSASAMKTSKRKKRKRIAPLRMPRNASEPALAAPHLFMRYLLLLAGGRLFRLKLRQLARQFSDR